MAKKDERVDKRRVEMRSVFAAPAPTPDEPDRVHIREHQATDYVRPDYLDAYVADAQTRWQSVTVSDEPDAGPAGYDGATTVHAHLNHPLAGTYYPASDCENCTHAPDGYRTVKA